MPSVRRLRSYVAALGVGLGLLAVGRSAEAERIGVVQASDASSEAARYLDEQLDQTPTHRETKNARALDALRREARTEWRDDLVIVLDAEGAPVVVLRPVDGAHSSRTLAKEAADEAYVVAVAAVELLPI